MGLFGFSKKIKLMIKEHEEVTKRIYKTQVPLINEVALMVWRTIKTKKNTIFVAGNGGSASDAQHLAGELIGRFKRERRAFPCIALNTDTSVMTAIGNDYGFEKIFVRQLEGLAKKNDLFIAISTSGNSANLIEAVEYCKKNKIRTILLSGRNGGRLAKLCDASIIVPPKDDLRVKEHNNTPRIQECHIMIIHIICDVVEERLCRFPLS